MLPVALQRVSNRRASGGGGGGRAGWLALVLVKLQFQGIRGPQFIQFTFVKSNRNPHIHLDIDDTMLTIVSIV